MIPLLLQGVATNFTCIELSQREDVVLKLPPDVHHTGDASSWRTWAGQLLAASRVGTFLNGCDDWDNGVGMTLTCWLQWV